MKAHIAEQFKWIHGAARPAGITIDGIPGMFVVQQNNLEESMDSAINEWNNSFHSYDVLISPEEIKTTIRRIFNKE